jgi:hypothetical protein
MPPQEPNGLVLFILCFIAAGGLIGLFWLNHYLRTGGASVNRSQDAPAPEPRADGRTGRTARTDLVSLRVLCACRACNLTEQKQP